MLMQIYNIQNFWNTVMLKKFYQGGSKSKTCYRNVFSIVNMFRKQEEELRGEYSQFMIIIRIYKLLVFDQNMSKYIKQDFIFK